MHEVLTVNNNTSATAPVAVESSQEASERHQLINAVRNHFGESMKDTIARIDAFAMPRLERERHFAETRRRVEGQRHYAGQVMAALCSETDRTVQLSDEALEKVCRQAHRIAKCMVKLEVEYIGDDA